MIEFYTNDNNNFSVCSVAPLFIIGCLLTCFICVSDTQQVIAQNSTGHTLRSYENDINIKYPSGWGILLIFSADQALVQSLAPYPPFGLVTITVVAISSYLILFGIYSSASLISANNEFRKAIYKHTSESRLLRSIGQAELQKEIRKTVDKITRDKAQLIDTSESELITIDEKELRKYIDFVVKELKKDVSNK